MNIENLCKANPCAGEMFREMKAVQKESGKRIGCVVLRGYRNLFHVKLLEELGLIRTTWITTEADEGNEDASPEAHVHYLVNKGALKRLKLDDVLDVGLGIDWRKKGNDS